MSQVKGKNTLPELAVRKLVFAMGFRFRLHVANLPGKPDLVFPRLRKVIFVNGCFWHGHRSCRYGRLPKSRQEFWTLKIAGNRSRDRRAIAALKREGWEVLTVWTCEVRQKTTLLEKLHDFLRNS